jgi:hypothetical protein
MMRDDELKAGFDTLLGAVREAPPPPISVIASRLRRRRLRIAVAGAAAVAALVAVVLSVHLTATPARVTAPASHPPTGLPPARAGVRQSSISYTVSPPVRTLVLSADASQVTISGSQGRAVSVTVHAHFSQAPPALTRSRHGRTLRLGYACPAERDCGASYRIRLPAGTSVSVTLRTGPITLSGLAGPVTASTGTGTITATRLSSARVSLRTGTGTIIAGFTSRPASVQAAVRTGAISIGAPGTAAYNVNASASAFIINVNIGTSPDTITAQVTTGTLTIVPGAPARSMSAAERGGINDSCLGPQRCTAGSFSAPPRT